MKSTKIWAGVYIVAVLVANYTADTFIQTPVFGLLSLGTLFFGVTFTARDYMHSSGRKFVYTTIFITALLAIAMSVFLDVAPRIILASFLAIVISESADTEVYQKHLQDAWLVRVLKSNAVSIPLDTLLFTFVAFFGVFPLLDLGQIVFADILYKSIVGLFTAGVRYVRFPQLT